MGDEGKINIFGLGEKGVVNAKDPIHVVDGELMQSQNAIANNPDEGIGGLEKRGGMTKLNSSVLGGAVLSLANIPLEDPISGYGEWIYAPYLGAGVQYFCSSAAYDYWVTNNPGLLANNDAAPGLPAEGTRQYSKLAAAFPAGFTGVYGSTSCARVNNKLYYAADNYTVDSTAPPIRCFTGTKDFEFARIPEWFDAGTRRHAKAIVRLIQFDGYIYLTTWDGGTSPNYQGRVFRLDAETGTLLLLGAPFGNQAGENAGGMPFSLCGWQGRLWCGTANNEAAPAGTVWWIRPNLDTAWTLDHTCAANQGNVLALSGFGATGSLYVGTDGVGGAAAGLVLQRTPLGVWSTSDTGLRTGTRNRYDILIEFEDILYAHYWEPDITVPVAGQWVIRSYNGTAWSTSVDIISFYAALGINWGQTMSGASALAMTKLLIFAFGNDPTLGGNAIELYNGAWKYNGVLAFGGCSTPLGYIRSDSVLNTFHT